MGYKGVGDHNIAWTGDLVGISCNIVTTAVLWDTVPLPNERQTNHALVLQLSRDSRRDYQRVPDLNVTCCTTTDQRQLVRYRQSMFELELLAVILILHEYHNQLTLFNTNKRR
jgi:hypothetical protein